MARSSGNMIRYPIGTIVRARFDLHVHGVLIHAGTLGKIVRVGIDASFGFYVVEFPSITMLFSVAPAFDAQTEVAQ